MHLGLKRNFQVMPGAEWLELLCKHILDRHEHLLRYVGWYSNRARGERAMVEEEGVLKRAIVYHSDVLNTAARVQALCNEHGKTLLVTDAVKARLAGSPYRFDFIGDIILRGKAQAVGVCSVERARHEGCREIAARRPVSVSFHHRAAAANLPKFRLTPAQPAFLPHGAFRISSWR